MELYASPLAEEREAVITGVEVEELFQEANLELPDQIQRRMDEVRVFHDAVVENRQQYLKGEIDRLGAVVASRDEEIAAADHRRAELMEVLSSTSALDEYTRRQELLVELRGHLHDVEARLRRLKEVTQARADLEAR
jgi:uncharacterized protein YydD (DUF2326 family)